MEQIFQTEDIETGETLETPMLLATVAEADLDVAIMVLDQDIGDNGRSGWKWFRLANGDLILGVFPHGVTYFNTEADPNRP